MQRYLYTELQSLLLLLRFQPLHRHQPSEMYNALKTHLDKLYMPPRNAFKVYVQNMLSKERITHHPSSLLAKQMWRLTGTMRRIRGNKGLIGCFESNDVGESSVTGYNSDNVD